MPLRVNECTLTKGNYTTTIYSKEITEDFSNKLMNITPPTGKQNQDATTTQFFGQKQTKVVDLLRIVRKFIIKGYILNNIDKLALIRIIRGAGIKGGAITFSYPDGADTTSFNVFIESFKISQKATDEPDSPPDDYAKYDIDITLVEGTTVAG